MTWTVKVRGQSLTAETCERLETFEALLARWSPKINLVSKSTLGDIRERHVLDSIQLYDHMPETALKFADFGSGGGLPGIIMAILSTQFAPKAQHILVESDQRKATFLREAARSCQVNVKVISDRIESVAPLNAEVVTARALAALPQLFAWISPHMAPSAVAILPKGEAFQSEVDAALEKWQFDLSVHKSVTEPLARILCVTALSRRS
ncbi:16S rRNA (guanine(527)-N(7))-methyltransferase RsmG [Falsigemmobacter faecalis]|uniref:Ribosomal RNA small subunit methyltransferase G n=1 Tax=Falsigemmobacter faecalis TaxID=2488730 RepID=A0A3P3DUN2_9RHOB|nr:16S rRNA (guanine(527)-N(7))-methyltransferase RsmG [Falsigemmobacter faecalis]RRH77875.1 16S rRNA (guanine(527)-N(7))-methyltransferase RsmG [Falsigemmobacter faecalis]